MNRELWCATPGESARLLECPGNRQNHRIVEADAVIRIDVLEEDISLRADEIDRGCGQGLLARTLEDDPQFAHEGQIGVSQKIDAQSQSLRRFCACSGIFTTDGEQLVPELRKLPSDFFQLDQLVATESSPPTAVEDEDGRFCRDGAAEIEALAFYRLQLRWGHGCAHQ